MSVPARAPRSLGRERHTISRRVREMLRASVREGHLVVDELLVENHLVESLQASRNAVRAALQQLAEEGVVDRQPRRGTVVLRRGITVPMRDVTTEHATVTLEIVEQAVVPATPLLRHRLDIPDPTVRMIENVFRADDEIIGVRTAYFSRRFATPTYAGPPAMAVVFPDFFGVPLGRVETRIGSTAADERTSRLLGLAPGAPVLVREQLMRDAGDRPVQVVFDNYRGDRVTFGDDGVPQRGGANGPIRPLPAA